MDGTEGMDNGYVQSLLLLALDTGTGTSVWRMMVIGKWIEASNEQVGTWTGPPAGSNTAAAAYHPEINNHFETK